MAQWVNTDYAKSARPDGYLDEAEAVQIYTLATHLDGIPGNTYPGVDQGSSGGGAAKAAKKLGFIHGYRWTFNMNGFLAALQTQPLIVGTAFYAGMEDPDSRGLVRPTGQLEGGHEYLMLNVVYERVGAELEWVNSWSDQWGQRGHAYTSITDFSSLLVDREMPGDVTVPVL